MPALKIPVTFGKNRVRGSSVGPMVDDGFGEANYYRLRAILRHEASVSGLAADDEWLNSSVQNLLSMYEEAHEQWKACHEDTIGHVFEARLPSGDRILLGDRIALSKVTLE